jgi:putative intracellular protease/amidase
VKVLIPLPHSDFDPTEAAVSWKVVRDAGHDVFFATPQGRQASADARMIHGEGLDPWGFVPLLKKFKLVGLILRAAAPARVAYSEMQRDSNFISPLAYSDLNVEDFDGLILPGGHAPGMRRYLEDEILQRFVAEFFEPQSTDYAHKPIGAVCHGVVLAARSTSAKTGRSVLYGRKTTALTWSQEQSAWRLTKYFARFWDPSYYRTYSEQEGDPDGYWSVEAEVKRALAADGDFVTVPSDAKDVGIKTDNLHRDSLDDSRPAWVVRDGNYVSARWPGDVHTFAKRFVEMLAEQPKGSARRA